LYSSCSDEGSAAMTPSGSDGSVVGIVPQPVAAAALADAVELDAALDAVVDDELAAAD
jgi:hypothetical protein